MYIIHTIFDIELTWTQMILNSHTDILLVSVVSSKYIPNSIWMKGNQDWVADERVMIISRVNTDQTVDNNANSNAEFKFIIRSNHSIGAVDALRLYDETECVTLTLTQP